MLLALKERNKDLVTILLEKGVDINAPFVDVRNIGDSRHTAIVIPPVLSICIRIFN